MSMDSGCEAAVTYSRSWCWLREAQRAPGISVWIGIVKQQ